MKEKNNENDDYEKFFDPYEVSFIKNDINELKEISKAAYGDYPFYITDEDIKRLKNGEIMIVGTNFDEYICYFKYLKEK